MHPREIAIADYTYTLPEEKIALFPLEQRDNSKLLIYRNGIIQEDTYQHLAAYLPEQSLLVFNNTRVIPARLRFQKLTGSIIEIFCLEPFGIAADYNQVMQQTECVQWKCLIGGASKWKEGLLERQGSVDGQPFILQAALTQQLSDAYVVTFSWQPAALSFAAILQQAGETPLPPYIKRKVEEKDKDRYQTIYAAQEGSVAAPTAGLHFTETIFASLQAKQVQTAYVTLHVGAGTFKPVKAARMDGHEMHTEWMEVSRETIEVLLQNQEHTIVATGTTSLRTMESLYWLGVKILQDVSVHGEALTLTQWAVYEPPLASTTVTATQALTALLNWMGKRKLETFVTRTQLLIVPGYSFRIANALITNFHQPQSTLLLLVAAAVGPGWKKIYQHALDNHFRFLSYGDGSLLFISPE